MSSFHFKSNEELVFYNAESKLSIISSNYESIDLINEELIDEFQTLKFNNVKRSSELKDSTEDSIKDSIEDSTEDSTEDSIKDSTEDSIEDSIKDSIEELDFDKEDEKEIQITDLLTASQVSLENSSAHNFHDIETDIVFVRS